ncbi:MAG: hypothetical protein DRP85_07435 [Candidatus Makaraimicrobium thalassicum]|nr:MAG: hypothetical protein DRP85_07435 [Candidatus Omnitrophota bacterium]
MHPQDVSLPAQCGVFAHFDFKVPGLSQVSCVQGLKSLQSACEKQAENIIGIKLMQLLFIARLVLKLPVDWTVPLPMHRFVLKFVPMLVEPLPTPRFTLKFWA